LFDEWLAWRASGLRYVRKAPCDQETSQDLFEDEPNEMNDNCCTKTDSEN